MTTTRCTCRTTTPNAEARYRARFYFDPNTIGMGTGESHYILVGYSGPSTGVLFLQLLL